jgi:hypothetical protein
MGARSNSDSRPNVRFFCQNGAAIIKSARKMDERAGESFGYSFDARFTDVTL